MPRLEEMFNMPDPSYGPGHEDKSRCKVCDQTGGVHISSCSSSENIANRARAGLDTSEAIKSLEVRPPKPSGSRYQSVKKLRLAVDEAVAETTRLHQRIAELEGFISIQKSLAFDISLHKNDELMTQKLTEELVLNMLYKSPII